MKWLTNGRNLTGAGVTPTGVHFYYDTSVTYHLYEYKYASIAVLDDGSIAVLFSNEKLIAPTSYKVCMCNKVGMAVRIGATAVYPCFAKSSMDKSVHHMDVKKIYIDGYEKYLALQLVPIVPEGGESK